MQSRYFRKGLLDSETVSGLSDFAFRCYTLLQLEADYAGRYDARPNFVRSRLFPLGTSRRSQDVCEALDEIESTGLMIRYEYQGKKYLQLSKVAKVGNTKESIYPWLDGSYMVQYVRALSSDGPLLMVTTSISNHNTTPLVPHTDPIGTPSVPHPNKSKEIKKKERERKEEALSQDDILSFFEEKMVGTYPEKQIERSCRKFTAVHGTKEDWKVFAEEWIENERPPKDTGVKGAKPARKEIYVCEQCWRLYDDCVCSLEDGDAIKHAALFKKPHTVPADWSSGMAIGRIKEEMNEEKSYAAG